MLKIFTSRVKFIERNPKPRLTWMDDIIKLTDAKDMNRLKEQKKIEVNAFHSLLSLHFIIAINLFTEDDK